MYVLEVRFSKSGEEWFLYKERFIDAFFKSGFLVREIESNLYELKLFDKENGKEKIFEILDSLSFTKNIYWYVNLCVLHEYKKGKEKSRLNLLCNYNNLKIKKLKKKS